MPRYHATNYRTLKRYGRLPNVNLNALDKLELSGPAQAVAESIAQDHFCGCPDFADEEIAEADPMEVARFLDMELPDARDLVSMHAAMLAAKTGTGSFPAGCHAEAQGRHAAKLHFNLDVWQARHKRAVTDQELQGLVDAKYWELRDLSHAQQIWGGKPVVTVAVELTMESFRRRGIRLIPVSAPNQANIRLTSRPIGGGTIGLGWYNSQRCSDNVEARIDSNWNSTLHGYARLICHEIGHCNNLPHEFTNQNAHRSVMSYAWPTGGFDGFRPGPPLTVLPRDASIARLIRYYGDEAVPPVPEWMGPTVPPPPEPGDVVDLAGELHVDGTAIRGTLTAGRKTSYFFVPSGGGVYVPQRRVF
jgi:hypothetical protein